MYAMEHKCPNNNLLADYRQKGLVKEDNV